MFLLLLRGDCSSSRRCLRYRPRRRARVPDLRARRALEWRDLHLGSGLDPVRAASGAARGAVHARGASHLDGRVARGSNHPAHGQPCAGGQGAHGEDALGRDGIHRAAAAALLPVAGGRGGKEGGGEGRSGCAVSPKMFERTAVAV